jgi:hypothetical protein
LAPVAAPEVVEKDLGAVEWPVGVVGTKDFQARRNRLRR